MTYDQSISGNSNFSHSRFIDLSEPDYNGFAIDGHRSVFLHIKGRLINVKENVETNVIGGNFAFRRHNLSVSGSNTDGITRADVQSALREHDEFHHRVAVLSALRFRSAPRGYYENQCRDLLPAYPRTFR